MNQNMDIIDNIITSQLEMFVTNFTSISKSLFYNGETKSLIHPGEFGMLRESIVRDLLIHFLPESFGVSSGFIVSPNGWVSSQCDIIIYSKLFTPIIHTAESQRFYPIESVIAVGEIKSDLTKIVFEEAMHKLAEIKEMRASLKDPSIIHSFLNSIGPYNPDANHFDQVATFLIANKFEFDESYIIQIFDDINIFKKILYKPNLLLSIKEYVVSYKDNRNLHWMFPVDVDNNKRIIDKKLGLYFSRPTNQSVDHIKVFIRYLEMLVTKITILNTEFTHYFKDFKNLSSEDESKFKKA